VTAPDDRWPLSAAQTVLLRTPKTGGDQVLKLALKELLLAGTWRLTREPRPPSRWRRGPDDVVVVHRGPTPVPPLEPLGLLHERLHAAAPQGGQFADVVHRVLVADSRLGTRLRRQAVDDLVARRLLAQDRTRLLGVVPRTRTTVTPSGAAWDRDARERERLLAAGAPVGMLVSAGGLLLLLDPQTQRLVDEALRRKDESGADVVLLGDLSAVDGLPGLGPAVDSAVDAGTPGGGGDAGDGGGGD
jgi:hypothetical protein